MLFALVFLLDADFVVFFDVVVFFVVDFGSAFFTVLVVVLGFAAPVEAFEVVDFDFAVDFVSVFVAAVFASVFVVDVARVFRLVFTSGFATVFDLAVSLALLVFLAGSFAALVLVQLVQF